MRRPLTDSPFDSLGEDLHDPGQRTASVALYWG